jgi:hypothetical protein
MCEQRCGDVPFTILFPNRRADGVSMRCCRFATVLVLGEQSAPHVDQ